MTKQDIGMLEDIQGYIQEEIDNDDGKVGLKHVLANLSHDIGGVFREEKNFSPRVNGYKKFKTSVLVSKHFEETERGNLWITEGVEGYHLSYTLLQGDARQHDIEMTLLEISITPCNYPGLNVKVVNITPNDLAIHINKCPGWYIRKLDLVPDGSVKDSSGYII